MEKESSLRNTICLVIEFPWIHFIEILQLLILQNLCMQLGYTIDRITCNDSQMRHLNLTICNNCHLGNLIYIRRILVCHFDDKSSVDFFNDLINTW